MAELGFIPTGISSWSTIDLFSPQGRELLAKFRTTNIIAGTKSYTNGLVNPNTSYSDVIVAAFHGAPIEEYPGDPSAVKVDLPMAGLIASNFMAVSTNMAITASNTFDSAAGWVTISCFCRPRRSGEEHRYLLWTTIRKSPSSGTPIACLTRTRTCSPSSSLRRLLMTRENRGLGWREHRHHCRREAGGGPRLARPISRSHDRSPRDVRAHVQIFERVGPRVLGPPSRRSVGWGCLR